jgi:hypothetical protein
MEPFRAEHVQGIYGKTHARTRTVYAGWVGLGVRHWRGGGGDAITVALGLFGSGGGGGRPVVVVLVPNNRLV